MKTAANGAIKGAMTEEVMAAMNPEQLEIVNGAASAFDLNGKTTRQKAEEINNLIKKNVAFNS